MTGTNMSGDLKDPQKSIPSGTIAATLTTSIIYFTLALLFGSSITGAVLRDKNGKSLDSHMIVASLVSINQNEMSKERKISILKVHCQVA
jgi:amino acid transporter